MDSEQNHEMGLDAQISLKVRSISIKSCMEERLLLRVVPLPSVMAQITVFNGLQNVQHSVRLWNLTHFCRMIHLDESKVRQRLSPWISDLKSRFSFKQSKRGLVIRLSVAGLMKQYNNHQNQKRYQNTQSRKMNTRSDDTNPENNEKSENNENADEWGLLRALATDASSVLNEIEMEIDEPQQKNDWIVLDEVAVAHQERTAKTWWSTSDVVLQLALLHCPTGSYFEQSVIKYINSVLDGEDVNLDTVTREEIAEHLRKGKRRRYRNSSKAQ